MKRLSLICILLATLITTTLCLTACNKGEYVLPIDDDLRVNEVVSDNYRTFYEIFVGAFSDSNGDGVGDLRGIINRLDYLNDGDVNSGKSLGVTGIWLMPVMPSPSYHKYDVSEYDKIDAKYGSLEDMKELVSKCHSRGVNVIIDLVLNHTSTWNAWFIQAQRAQQQCNVDDYYYGFYSVKKGTPAGVWYDFCTDKNGESWVYEGNFDRGMPELNWDNPHVKEQVEQVIKFWLDEVGIDGFRLDAVIYFYLGNHAKNVEVLQWINDTCKKYNPNAYVIAENWTNEQTIVDYYSACNCFDFPF